MKSYIISILGISICCGIIRHLTKNKGTVSAIIDAICAVAVSIVVLSPLITVRIPELRSYTDMVQAEADIYIQQGTDLSIKQMRDIITQRTYAYIHDKATSMDCSLDISVGLSDGEIPIPVYVELSGSFSPYIKTQLSQVIESELGIAKEMQRWIYLN